MSKFNEYARRADKIAKEAFEEFLKAHANLKQAQQRANAYPPRHGMVDASYAANVARAKADLIEANEAYRKAQKAFDGHRIEIENIGRELEAAVQDAYSADSSQIDLATIELLKSGVMSASEYDKLLTQAFAAGNPTMARIIAKYAGNEADAISAKYGQNDEKALKLRAIAISGKGKGTEIVNQFGVLTDVFTRCTRNPRMIDHWEELTEKVVETL